MNAPSKDICTMLEAAGLSLLFGVNLFVGREPTAPENCVTVYDTPGFAPIGTLTQGDEVWQPAVQVRVRNRNYVSGYALINGIQEALHNLAHETWGGTSYLLIQSTQDPFLLDYDEGGNARFVCNFDIKRS